VRAYLPTTYPVLEQIKRTVRGGEMFATYELPAGVLLRTVTPGLRRQMPGVDEEDLEWEAFSEAALDALEQSVAEPNISLRVVLSLEVPAPIVAALPEAGITAMESTQAAGVPVIAVHADEPTTMTLLQAVAANLESQTAWQAAADADLLWYDVTEIDQIPT
jgi:hypothetical protein